MAEDPVFYCPRWGNTTPQELALRHEYEDTDLYNYDGSRDEGFSLGCTYEVRSCATCDDLILYHETEIWDVLNGLRNQISKSRRLISESAYRSLIALYDRIVEIDRQLTGIVISKAPTTERAKALSKLNHLLRWEITENLDEVIDMLAQEVQLKAQTTTAPSS